MRQISLLLIIIWLVAPLAPAPSYAQDDVTWLYERINTLRGSLGLKGYRLNGSLSAAAQAHSEWMAATESVSHTQDNGSTPGSRAVAFGYGGRFVSENIYSGYRAGAADAFNWWSNSSIHYAGMTHASKTDIGIGVARNGEMSYYTLVFGQGSDEGLPLPPPPAPAEPPTDIPPAPSADDAAPDAEQAVAEAPPPTNPPAPTRIVPTWTPSPTIASPTPTPTWTPTATWTPSPTTTDVPPTSTPIVLPSAAPLELAQLISPTPQVIQLPVVDEPEEEASVEADGFDWRDWLPVIIGIQVLGVGWVVYRLWKTSGLG